MDNERINKNNSSEEENPWAKMAAEAPAFNSRPDHGTRSRQIQKAEKMLEKAATPALNEKQSSAVEHQSDYQPEQWGIFESILEDDKKEQFREEMQKLDSKTANYLMALPRNISVIFGYNEESYKLWEETRTNIVETALAGKYSETETRMEENGEISRYSELGLKSKGKLSELDKLGLKPAPEIAATFEQKLGSFLSSIEEETDREEFMENFQKLDRKTQEFLLNFPDNASNLLPSLGEARSIVYKVRSKIIERTINGEFTPEAEADKKDEKISYHNLAIDDDDKLNFAYIENPYIESDLEPDPTPEDVSTPNKPKHDHGIRGRQMLKAENFPNHGEARKATNRMYFDMYKGKIPLVLPEDRPEEPISDYEKASTEQPTATPEATPTLEGTPTPTPDEMTPEPTPTPEPLPTLAPEPTPNPKILSEWIPEPTPESFPKPELTVYNPDSWAGFESKIEGDDKKAEFRSGIEKLDTVTSEYLRKLPGNIDQLLGVNEDSHRIMNEAIKRITENVINNTYIRETDGGSNDHIDKYGEYGPFGFTFIENGDRFDDYLDEEEGPKFYENLHKLDERTRRYIHNLPKNISGFLRDDKLDDSGSLYFLRPILGGIARRMVRGSYSHEGHEGFNLFLTKDGELFEGSQAYEAREKEYDEFYKKHRANL